MCALQAGWSLLAMTLKLLAEEGRKRKLFVFYIFAKTKEFSCKKKNGVLLFLHKSCQAATLVVTERKESINFLNQLISSSLKMPQVWVSENICDIPPVGRRRQLLSIPFVLHFRVPMSHYGSKKSNSLNELALWALEWVDLHIDLAHYCCAHHLPVLSLTGHWVNVIDCHSSSTPPSLFMARDAYHTECQTVSAKEAIHKVFQVKGLRTFVLSVIHSF